MSEDIGYDVLIETSWNVKEIILKIIKIKIRINRNIVECKVAQQPITDEFEFCINRNIVECKASERVQRIL